MFQQIYIGTNLRSHELGAGPNTYTAKLITNDQDLMSSPGFVNAFC